MDSRTGQGTAFRFSLEKMGEKERRKGERKEKRMKEVCVGGILSLESRLRLFRAG